jgi:hypothetical protein
MLRPKRLRGHTTISDVDAYVTVIKLLDTAGTRITIPGIRRGYRTFLEEKRKSKAIPVTGLGGL